LVLLATRVSLSQKFMLKRKSTFFHTCLNGLSTKLLLRAYPFIVKFILVKCYKEGLKKKKELVVLMGPSIPDTAD
jgi:hypothetical protein